MTTKPKLKLGDHLLPGLAAVALFVVLLAVFLSAEFGSAAGFPEGESVTLSIGLALFNLESAIPTEGFLVAFIVVAVVLDAALDGSLMLAKREEGGEPITALTDGGWIPGRGSDAGDSASAPEDDPDADEGGDR